MKLILLIIMALSLAACSSYGELPRGQFLKAASANDVHLFGTNTVHSSALVCNVRIKHWYKPDEIPSEYCEYTNVPGAFAPATVALASAGATPAPLATPTTITPVHVVKPVHTVKATPPVAAARVAKHTPIVTTNPVQVTGSSPQPALNFASSAGGGPLMVFGALTGAGVGAGLAAVRPSNVTQHGASATGGTGGVGGTGGMSTVNVGRPVMGGHRD